MKNITLFSVALLLLTACGKTRDRIQKGAEDLKEKVAGKSNDKNAPVPKPEQLKLTYSHAFVNRQSPFVIIPTHLETVLIDKGEPSDLYSNLLFLNPETGEVNVLDTNYVGFIENFQVLTPQSIKTDSDGNEIEEPGYEHVGKNAPGSLVFLEIANSRLQVDKNSTIWGSLYNRGTTGYNIYLAIVNHNGKNFTTLTPDNSAVVWWQFIQDGAGFLAAAVVDSDNNGKIEDSDKVELFYTNLLKPAQGQTIVPASLQQSLTSDYIKRKTAFEQKSN